MGKAGVPHLLLDAGLRVLEESGSRYLFVFRDSAAQARAMRGELPAQGRRVVMVLPRPEAAGLSAEECGAVAVVPCWSGDQSRFSRIKYAFLQAVLDGIIGAQDRVVCLLGPAGKPHLDTLTVHELSESWSEEFPFDVGPLISTGYLHTIMAVLDIALDVGAQGREGGPVGTIFTIGDSEAVMELSHQVVFNPFKGYREDQRLIDRPDVVESLKELAKLDGAIVISSGGVVEAAARHLDPKAGFHLRSRGLGARHRAAAGMSACTRATVIAVSQSSGTVSIFNSGRLLAAIEPLSGRRPA